MTSVGTQQLNELDSLIKNTEFETSQQSKGITEEKQKIDALQVQLHEYQNKLKELKDAASVSEENGRKFHYQLIRHKENYESLKKTSTVLDDHSEALQRKLYLVSHSSKDQRNTQLDAVGKYQCIWHEYERKYQSSNKAQELLKLRNEFESLDSRKSFQEREFLSLESQLSIADQSEKEYKEWILWIVRIASLRVETEGNVHELVGLNERYAAKLSYLEKKRQEISSIKQKIQHHKQKKSEEELQVPSLQLPNAHSNQQTEPKKTTPTPEKLSLRLEVPKPSKIQTTKTCLPAKRSIFTLNLPSQPARSVLAVPTLKLAQSTKKALPKQLSTNVEPVTTPVSEDCGGMMHQHSSSDTKQTSPSNITTVTESVVSSSSSVELENPDTSTEQIAVCPPHSENNTTLSPIREEIPSFFSESVTIPGIESGLLAMDSINVGTSDENTSSLFDFSTATGQTDQQAKELFSNQNVPNGGDLFTEESNLTGSSWFEKGESSNFDMFSSFGNGSTNTMGNLFGDTSDASNNGVVSLFATPKATHEEAAGFQAMSFDEPSSSSGSLFSLFR